MRDYVTIGSTPADEDCAQVGSADYSVRARKECAAFVKQLIRQFGPPPEGARVHTKGFSHDYGTYHEVVVSFDDDNEAAVEYAYTLESETPLNWDSEAKAELAE